MADPVCYLKIDDHLKYSVPAGETAYRQCGKDETGAFAVVRIETPTPPSQVAGLSREERDMLLHALEAYALGQGRTRDERRAYQDLSDKLARTASPSDQMAATADANTGEALPGLITGASSHARGSGPGRPLTPADQMVATIDSLELPIVGHQWLHHDPDTGNEFWLDSQFLKGKRSNLSRAVYLDPKPAIRAALAKLEDQP